MIVPDPTSHCRRRRYATCGDVGKKGVPLKRAQPPPLPRGQVLHLSKVPGAATDEAVERAVRDAAPSCDSVCVWRDGLETTVTLGFDSPAAAETALKLLDGLELGRADLGTHVTP